MTGCGLSRGDGCCLCLRVAGGRPIAHVAAEAGISRRCLAKWYGRWRAHGEDGLLDHSFRPAVSSPAGRQSPLRHPRQVVSLTQGSANRSNNTKAK
ncbi:helix-turn-helix domain-containing protein [Streptomyces sp. Qhu-G9]|uniref:helix-turn-helix domain-containing protein n=1 Tax=Streptomyces sp. Qhu-G9 TaxID=3452799 RepID=UPI003AF66FCC